MEVWGDQLLLPSQRNELHEAVRQSGLPPSDFELGPKYNPNIMGLDLPMPRLIHKPGGRLSGYYFQVEPREDGIWLLEASPGQATRTLRMGVRSWPEVLHAAEGWLVALKRELGQPDLWAGVLAAPPMEPPAAGNEPLTPDEIAEVRRQIDGARRYLAELGLANERMAYANEQLDYLVEASKRMGRFDWRQVAAGIAINIAVAAAFNPEQARALFQLVVEPIQRLLGG